MDTPPLFSTPPLHHLDAPPAVAEGLASAWFHAGGDMPEAEVWLALALEEHPQHRAARAYWTLLHEGHAPGARPMLWFSRVTMLGLIQQLCQYIVPGKGVLDLRAAWTVYRTFRGLPGVGLLAEPEDCETRLHTLMSPRVLPDTLWPSAYLGALSQATTARLVTFDPAVEQLHLDRWLLLAR